MPKSHRFLTQYLIVPSTLLAPATHIQTNKPTNPQRYTRLRHWHEICFQNSSKRLKTFRLLPSSFQNRSPPNPLRKARYRIKTTLSDRSSTLFRGGKKILKGSGRDNSEKIRQILRHIYWQAIVVLIVLQPITDLRWQTWPGYSSSHVYAPGHKITQKFAVSVQVLLPERSQAQQAKARVSQDLIAINKEMWLGTFLQIVQSNVLRNSMRMTKLVFVSRSSECWLFGSQSNEKLWEYLKAKVVHYTV